MLYNIDCLIIIIIITIVFSIENMGECMYNSNRPVKWTEHPYVVRLHMWGFDPKIQRFKETKCTGVMVARDKALTAGHCVTWGDVRPKIKIQQIGQQKNKQTNKFETRWFLRPVVKAIVLPDYYLTPMSDLAMLYLSENDDTIDGEPIGKQWTVDLPEISDELPEEGQRVNIFGFERENTNDDNQLVYLQQIWSVPIENILHPNHSLTLFNLKSATVQEGDSGSPVVDTDTGDLIGLLSRARKNDLSDEDSHITFHSANPKHNVVTEIPSAWVFYFHDHQAIINKFIAYTEKQFERSDEIAQSENKFHWDEL